MSGNVFKRYQPYVNLAKSALAGAPAAYATMQNVLGQVRGFKNTAQRLTAAQALKKTVLKSYMDKTYEKKCGIEVKQKLLGTTAVVPTTSLATWYSPFQAISQGLTDETRIGNSIEVKSLHFRCDFYGHATLLSRVRIIVCKQGLMQGAVPASADILEDPNDIKSYYALNKDTPFTIIKDTTFELTPLSTNDSMSQKTWKFTYKPKGCHLIRYLTSSTTGLVSDMIQGNLSFKIMHDGGLPSAANFLYKTEWVDS